MVYKAIVYYKQQIFISKKTYLIKRHILTVVRKDMCRVHDMKDNEEWIHTQISLQSRQRNVEMSAWCTMMALKGTTALQNNH